MRALLSFRCLILFASLSITQGDGNENECTSGFMSVDRMDALLRNFGDTFKDDDFQGIFPEVGFTSKGRLVSWVFGAEWEGNSQSFTELQIWRPVGEDGVYTKVGSTTIITPETRTQLYHYPLSTPLDFRAGDVLGYYQPPSENSQLRLIYEGDERGQFQLGYYYKNLPSSPSVLDTREGSVYRTYQMLINVETDPPYCGYGFVSVERMRLLLDIDSVAGTEPIEGRQQITPDMSFTCDGVITSWIIGAYWNRNNSLFPEFQVWRNVGNNTYQKIHGTVAELPTRTTTYVYVFSDFQPLPILAGDVVGIFTPNTSRLIPLSETTSSPTNYYMPSGDSEESSVDIINVESNIIMVEPYRPLVSAVIATSPSVATSVLPTEVSVEELAIAVGLSTTIALLLTLTVITITVILCVRRRTRSFPLITAANEAYHSQSGQFTRTHESNNRPLPLPPRVLGLTGANGATPNNENPSVGAMDNVAYGVLQNEAESFNDVSVKENISYGAYTEGDDYEYAIVSGGSV